MHTVNNLQVLDAINMSAHDNLDSTIQNTSAILSEEFAQNVATMAGNERLSIALDDSIKNNALVNQSAIERNGMANTDTTYRTASSLGTAIERVGLEELNTVERVAGELKVSIEREKGCNDTSQQRIACETRFILSENNTAAALLGKDIQLDVNRNTNTATLQASNHFNKTELKLKKVEAEVKLRAIKTTSLINLEALKDKASLESESLTNCCNLKEVVNNTSYVTNKLSRDIEYTRMRDLLTSATTECLLRNC